MREQREVRHKHVFFERVSIIYCSITGCLFNQTIVNWTFSRVVIVHAGRRLIYNFDSIWPKYFRMPVTIRHCHPLWSILMLSILSIEWNIDGKLSKFCIMNSNLNGIDRELVSVGFGGDEGRFTRNDDSTVSLSHWWGIDLRGIHRQDPVTRLPLKNQTAITIEESKENHHSHNMRIAHPTAK